MDLSASVKLKNGLKGWLALQYGQTDSDDCIVVIIADVKRVAMRLKVSDTTVLCRATWPIGMT